MLINCNIPSERCHNKLIFCCEVVWEVSPGSSGLPVLPPRIFFLIKLLQKSHKAITTENLATAKELKKDLLILATLFVLLGMSLVFTAALILASGVFQDRSASTSPLFIIGFVISLLQRPALFLL